MRLVFIPDRFNVWVVNVSGRLTRLKHKNGQFHMNLQIIGQQFVTSRPTKIVGFFAPLHSGKSATFFPKSKKKKEKDSVKQLFILVEPSELPASINFTVTRGVYSHQICFRSDFIYDIVEPMKPPSVPTTGTKKSKKRPTVSSQFKVNLIFLTQ